MNDFDAWNTLKKNIHLTLISQIGFPKEGEVWMCSLGRNIGYEQNGTNDNFTRPVLIVKKFNNQMFWSVPLSTKQKTLDFYFNFTDRNNREVSAIIAQMKLMSAKRLKRKLYEFPKELLEQIRHKLIEFLK